MNIPQWYAPLALSYGFVLFHFSVYAVPESVLLVLEVLNLHSAFQSGFISIWIVFKLLVLKCPFLLKKLPTH